MRVHVISDMGRGSSKPEQTTGGDPMFAAAQKLYNRLRLRPEVERLDGRTIRVRADRWWDAWQLFFFDR